MKFRAKSALLVLLVTLSILLSALPASAAKGKTSSKDYDALLVKDGLVGWFDAYDVGNGTVDLANPYEYLTIYLADIPVTVYNMKDAKPIKLTEVQTPPYVVYNDSTKTED